MNQAISLLALNQLIKETLEDQLEPSYWLLAEVAEIKQASNGHAYLDLVEKNGNQVLAKMRANIWAYSYRMIAAKFRSVTGQDLKSGMKILAQVVVTFHEVYGMSLNVKDIDPNFTLGERARLRQEIIDRLSREGLLDLSKRFLLPTVPQEIAIISSETAAGYGDFVNQLKNNPYGYAVHYQLFQATLQGSEAAKSMIKSLERIMRSDNSFDAIAIIRGGGAALDLDCFDDYELAKAIALSDIPVLTGIGHERDETIADLVAHTKIKTPTALAEFILSGFREFEEKLHELIRNIQRAVGRSIQEAAKEIQASQHRLESSGKFILQREKEKNGFFLKQFQSLTSSRIKTENKSLEDFKLGFQKAWRNRLDKEFYHVSQLEKSLQRLDPQTFFKKGYSRVELEGIPLHLAKPEIGKEIQVYADKLSLSSTITEIKSSNGKRD